MGVGAEGGDDGAGIQMKGDRAEEPMSLLFFCELTSHRK